MGSSVRLAPEGRHVYSTLVLLTFDSPSRVARMLGTAWVGLNGSPTSESHLLLLIFLRWPSVGINWYNLPGRWPSVGIHR